MSTKVKSSGFKKFTKSLRQGLVGIRKNMVKAQGTSSRKRR